MTVTVCNKSHSKMLGSEPEPKRVKTNNSARKDQLRATLHETIFLSEKMEGTRHKNVGKLAKTSAYVYMCTSLNHLDSVVC